MKKIFCIFIATILFMNILPIAPSFASSAATDDAALARAVRLLEDLGIAEEGEDVSASVTRAEFVGRIANVLGLALSYEYDVSPFVDIDVQNPYYYQICNALSWGLVSPAHKFYPEREVSYAEAMKIAVCATGYSFYAEANGGWSAGYINAANRLKLSDGVSNGTIDRASMFVIFYNILSCPLPDQEYTGDGVTNIMSSTKTILQTMWHLNKASGVVDAAQFFGGANGVGVGEGLVSVGGVVLRCGNFGTDKYYATEVDAYYDQNNTICSLYAYDTISSNSVLELHSYDDVTYASNTYTYEAGDNRYANAVVTRDALVVYNGKKSSYDESRMLPEYGSVKLIKGKNGQYDTVIINSYSQVVVDEVSYDDFIIADYYDRTNSISLDKNAIITVSDQDGAASVFSDIEKTNVLWVAQSDDKSLVDIIISRDKIVGEYTASGDNNTAMYIDDGKYNIDRNITGVLSEVKYGEVVIAYFNANREVVLVEAQSSASDVNIGYLVQTALFGGTLSRSLKAKLLATDGTFLSFDFAPKFRINGKTYIIDSDYAKIPKDSAVTSSMPIGIISYTVNADNELAEINYPDTRLKEVGGVYTNLYEKETLDKTDADTKSWEQYFQYRPAEKSLYGKGVKRIFAGDNTVQFKVPVASNTSSAVDTDYVTKLMSSYTDLTYLTKMRHTGYSLSEEAYRSDFIVSAYDLNDGANAEAVSWRELMYLVTNVSRVVTNEGTHAEKLDGVDYQNRPITLYSEEQGYFTNAGVEKGCIIKAQFNAKNIVSGVNVLYKPGNTTFSNSSNLSGSDYTSNDGNITLNYDAGMNTLSNSFLFLGYVWEKQDPIYSFLPINKDPSKYDSANDETTGPLYVYHMPTHIKQFVCYNTKTGQVSYIKPADVKTCAGISSASHKVVLEMSYGMVDSIFLYE